MNLREVSDLVLHAVYFNRNEASSNTNTKICQEIQNCKTTFLEILDDRYAPFGVMKGDVLVIPLTADFHEDNLSVFKIYGSNTWCIGFAYDNFNDVAIIHPDGIDKFKRHKLVYIGYVSKIIKSFEPVKQFKGATKQADNSEIYVKCAECGTEATGSRAFLSAMAWKLNKNETLCNSCRW